MRKPIVTSFHVFRITIIFSLCVPLLSGDDTKKAEPGPAKAALEKLNGLIGEWRGTGQVRRGSANGAWRQTGIFVWDFSGDAPAIRYTVQDGQLTAQALIRWNADDNYFLELTTADGKKRDLTGKWDSGKVVFGSAPDAEGVRYRITLTPLNEKRALVLHEKSAPGGQSFFRIAEVGYTRAGTRLALPGGGQRECVVTGGTAQTAVTYKGETYYVCCSGCKQAFDDDPEGIIADFKARLKERLESSIK